MSNYTQRMTMHLNGGSKFSKLIYAIKRDGRETPIRRIVVTDGSPQYRITSDILVCGDDEFNLRKCTIHQKMTDWCDKHSAETGAGDE